MSICRCGWLGISELPGDEGLALIWPKFLSWWHSADATGSRLESNCYLWSQMSTMASLALSHLKRGQQIYMPMGPGRPCAWLKSPHSKTKAPRVGSPSAHSTHSHRLTSHVPRYSRSAWILTLSFVLRVKLMSDTRSKETLETKEECNSYLQTQKQYSWNHPNVQYDKNLH